MISIETEARIARIFVITSLYEKKIETTRQVLAEQEGFDCYTCFYRLDKDNDGKLDVNDITEFFASNNIQMNQDDIMSFIQAYDKDKDQSLNFEEFLNCLLPATSSNLRKIVISRKQQHIVPKIKLQYEVEYAIQRIIEQEIVYQKELDNARYDLVNREDFSVKDCYESIQQKGLNNEIDYDNLYRFLLRNGTQMYEEDILSILRRFDKDQDTKLSYQEFSDVILPQSFRKTLRNPHLKQEKDNSFQSPLRQKKQFIDKGMRSTETKAGSMIDYTTPSRGFTQDKGSLFTTPYQSNLKFEQQTMSDQFQFSFNQPQQNEQLRIGKLQSEHKLQWPLKSATYMEPYEEDELARVIKEFIQLDKEVESTKQLLSLKTDFSIEDCYRIFDIEGKGFITLRDLEDAFNFLQMYPQIEQLEIVLQSYDRDQDGKLNFQEFCQMIVPKDKNYASLIMNRKSYNLNQDFQRKETFTPDTMREFINFLIRLTQNESKSERLREQLKMRPKFDISDAFKSLDKKQKGLITKNDLSEFLEDTHYFATEKELSYLMNRFDKDQDGIISYSEFVQELTNRLHPRV